MVNMSRNVRKYLQTRAPREDSDQTAHLPSLIKIYIRRILDSQGFKVSSWDNTDWSDRADTQADMNLLGANVSEVRFSHVAAHLNIVGKKNLKTDNFDIKPLNTAALQCGLTRANWLWWKFGSQHKKTLCANVLQVNLYQTPCIWMG